MNVHYFHTFFGLGLIALTFLVTTFDHTLIKWILSSLIPRQSLSLTFFLQFYLPQFNC